ncbi:hypothetical protein Stok01_00837 [Sulfurisphaera tokodaii]
MRKEKIGILLQDNTIIYIENVSKNENRFEINTEEFYKYLPKIKAIIHTHKESCEPSIIDIIGMIYWNFPWIIASNNCVKSYRILDFSIFEIDINSLIPQEFNNLIMQLSQ